MSEWNGGLTQAKGIGRATAARLRTTARAMDPHPLRTAAIGRLSLFDGLATSDAEPCFRDDRVRTILRAAAQLHAIHVNGRHNSRHKAASNFLRAVPVPPGWKSDEWALLADVVRYHRGAEPAAAHKRFAQLSHEDQDRVRGLAGVLRLARGLRRCRVTVADGVRLFYR